MEGRQREPSSGSDSNVDRASGENGAGGAPGPDGVKAAAVDGDASAVRASDIEVLVVGPLGRGGIHSYIEEQVQRLGPRLSVSVHDSGAPPIEPAWARPIRGLVRGMAAISRFPTRSPPDVVHVHTSHRVSFYRASVYVSYAKYVWNVPVVLHIHGSAFDDFVTSRSQAVGALQDRVFDACDEIIVLSEYWKEIVSLRAPEAKIRVLPNAVDPETFEADPTDEKPHLVFVSNLIERKGILELATAIEQLRDRHEGQFRVSIAGDGPLADRVEKLASEYDEVSYFGYVSEERKRELLRDGTVYVLPTHAEGLPIAMLEGMAGGNAVVTTAVGSIPEVIGPDRGLLVEPGDVGSLVRALEALLTDPDRRRRLAENNRQAVEELYSWDRVVEELVDIYRTHRR